VSNQRDDVERILRERSAALARVQARGDDRSDRGEALVIRVGRARYAVPLVGLAGLVVLDAVTPLPGAPSFVAGLAQVHGHVLTIVDLGVMLGEPPGTPSAALLVEAKSESFGLGVSAYESVVALPASGLSPPPAGLSETRARYIEGVVATSGLGLLRLSAVKSDLLRDESGDGDRES
jgi:purine-binding chemotaxis protein CheW